MGNVSCFLRLDWERHQQLYFAAQNGQKKKNATPTLLLSFVLPPHSNQQNKTKNQSRLGGGEGVEGLYGSITRTGTAKVLNSLSKHSSLDHRSHLVDVGAGLGRPLLHALADPGVAMASGVELDPVKCEKAEAFAVQARAALLLRRKKKKESSKSKKAAPTEEEEEEGGGEEEENPEKENNWTLPSLPDIQCCPVEALPSLDPATHVYSFWEGVPPTARAAFGKLVAASRTVRGVAVVQRAMRSRNGGGGEDGDDGGDDKDAGNVETSSPFSSSVPEAVMRDYGFGRLELRESFAVSMSGSGRSFRAYVFSREVVEEENLALAPVAAASDSAASEQTAAAAAALAASESPGSKPREGPSSSSSSLSLGRLPRACPLLAAAALAAERAAKEERRNGGRGSGSGGSGSWKNITTPTKPSPLSSSRAATPSSVGSSSSSSSSTLLFSSSSSSLGNGGPCDREARRARRRAGLPAAAAAAAPLIPRPSSLPPSSSAAAAAAAPLSMQQQQQQASIQSFCRVLRRAGVGGAGAGGAGFAKGNSSSSSSSRLARVTNASIVPVSASFSPAGKVLASPKKAGVTKGGGGAGKLGSARGGVAAARGLGAALVAASASASAQ